MTDTLTAEQIAELEALLAKATPGPWERDCCDHHRADTTHEVLFAPTGKVVLETSNSGVSVIKSDHDERGAYYWDEPGRNNLNLIAALRSAASTLIAMARGLIDANDTVRRFYETFMKVPVQSVAQMVDAVGAEAEIDRLSANLEHWRQEVGKLQSQQERAKKAEARVAELDRATDLAISINNDHVAEIERLGAERDKFREMAVRLAKAAKDIRDRKASTYRARNGRDVGIEADDGEKCFIVHSDEIFRMEAALNDPDIAALLEEVSHG